MCNETFDKTTLDEINTYDPHQFKIESLLPEWLEWKNDFNEAEKLIDDIEVEINKVKASKEDKKAFNDLNKLIINLNINNNVKKENAVERLNKNISDLDQLKQNKNKVLFFEIKWFKLFIRYLIHSVLIKSLHHCLAK